MSTTLSVRCTLWMLYTFVGNSASVVSRVGYVPIAMMIQNPVSPKEVCRRSAHIVPLHITMAVLTLHCSRSYIHLTQPGAKCHKPFPDGKYFEKDGRPYCETDYTGTQLVFLPLLLL
jgi:LIM domain-containing protein